MTYTLVRRLAFYGLRCVNCKPSLQWAIKCMSLLLVSFGSNAFTPKESVGYVVSYMVFHVFLRGGILSVFNWYRRTQVQRMVRVDPFVSCQQQTSVPHRKNTTISWTNSTVNRGSSSSLRCRDRIRLRRVRGKNGSACPHCRVMFLTRPISSESRLEETSNSRKIHHFDWF